MTEEELQPPKQQEIIKNSTVILWAHEWQKIIKHPGGVNSLIRVTKEEQEKGNADYLCLEADGLTAIELDLHSGQLPSRFSAFCTLSNISYIKLRREITMTDNMLPGQYHRHREETNELCGDCGNPHMDFVSTSAGGYPEFKCGCCGITKDYNPKVRELRKKIDNQGKLRK